MSLSDGRQKGTCSLWLKRRSQRGHRRPPPPVDRTPRRQLGPALAHRPRARLGSAERAAFHRALRAPASQDHQLNSRRSSRRTRAGDKKTTYETHNVTTVVNVTSYENRTVLENARLRRRNLNTARRRRRTKQHPTQVTIRETIIELENVTSRENVSVVVNETVLYNATYMRRRRRVIVDAPAFYSLNVGTTSRTTYCAISRTTSRSTRRTISPTTRAAAAWNSDTPSTRERRHPDAGLLMLRSSSM